MGQLCPLCDHWVARPELHEPEVCAAGAYARAVHNISPTWGQPENDGALPGLSGQPAHV